MIDEATSFFQSISKHLQPQDFKKFQELAQDGEKDLCWQILTDNILPKNLKAIQPMFDNFVKKKPYNMRQDSKRIPGHHLEADGCQIYLYPRLTLSKEKMAQAESILVVGQTGAGKSTYLNALVNFLERVPADCNKRYAITEYNVSNMSKGHSDTKSVRQYIIYNEKTMNKPLMVIDSPGFGDTSGIQQDDKIPILIKGMLRNTPKLNLVCFVVKSYTTKLAAIQKYIIESVCSIFARDVSPNFYFVLTFSDAHKPAVWNILEKSEYSGKIIDKIQGQKYVCLNNSALLKKLDPKSPLDMNYFKLGRDQLEVFMNKVHNTSPINMAQSICLTKMITPHLQNFQPKPSILASLLRKLVSCSLLSCKIIEQSTLARARIHYKAQSDPVTHIDHTVQKCIEMGLQGEEFEGVRVVGEEKVDEDMLDADLLGAFSQNGEEITGGFEWDWEAEGVGQDEEFAGVANEDICIFVDPLDCTRGYISGKYDECTVLIGITVKGKPILGIIAQPYQKSSQPHSSCIYSPRILVGGLCFRQKMYYYEYEHTKTLWTKVKMQENQPKKDGLLIAVSSRRTSHRQTKLLQQLLAENLPCGGSGNKLAMLIRCQIDAVIFVDCSLSSWDSCAGEAIVLALGGRLTRPNGNNIEYCEERDDQTNKEGYVSCLDDELYGKIVECLEKGANGVMF